MSKLHSCLCYGNAEPAILIDQVWNSKQIDAGLNAKNELILRLSDRVEKISCVVKMKTEAQKDLPSQLQNQALRAQGLKISLVGT